VQLVRHKVGKHTFEVACHPGVVAKWRNEQASWGDVLVSDTVFKSFSKGDKANVRLVWSTTTTWR
jgi:ribosome maturation protein Sdo1